MDSFADYLRRTRHTKKFVVWGLMLLLLPAIVVLANMKTPSQRASAAADASLSIEPAGVNQVDGRWRIPVGEEVQFDVKLSTVSHEAVAFSLQVAYDTSVLELVQNADPDTGIDPNFICNASPNPLNRVWVQRAPNEEDIEGKIILVCHILLTNQVGTTPIYQRAEGSPSGAKIAFPKNTTLQVATLKFRTVRPASGSAIRFSGDSTTGVIGWQECHQDFSILCDTADYRNNILQTYTDALFDVGVSPEVSPTPPPVTGTSPSLDAPPTIALTYPVDSTRLRRNQRITLTANATDDRGVERVDFYINNSLVCTDTALPYSCGWTVPNRRGVTYIVEVRAYDTAGQMARDSVSSVIR